MRLPKLRNQKVVVVELGMVVVVGRSVARIFAVLFIGDRSIKNRFDS